MGKRAMALYQVEALERIEAKLDMLLEMAGVELAEPEQPAPAPEPEPEQMPEDDEGEPEGEAPEPEPEQPAPKKAKK